MASLTRYSRRVDARVALLLVVAGACSRHSAAPRAELVGDPLGDWRTTPSEAFARNLWDLQAFDGKLFVGYGDWDVNTGPTDVISFDPKAGIFAHETTLPEEAIDRYRVLDGALYVPGVDAMDPINGAIYRRVAGQWQRIVLPQVAHALDVLRHGEELCVALQGRMSAGAVRCTRDDGATWSEMSTGSLRAESLFELGGELYVSSRGGVRRIHDGRSDPVELPMPGATVLHPTRCGDDVIFLVNSATRFDAFTMRSPDRVTHVEVSGSPADVFADGDACLVLTNRPGVDGRNEAIIYRRSKDQTWRIATSASTDSMARSAEILDGFYYLGLGCANGACGASAGTLVRVPVQPDLPGD